jgi:DNA (cytosine-5)-methyltransferase 1
MLQASLPLSGSVDAVQIEKFLATPSGVVRQVLRRDGSIASSLISKEVGDLDGEVSAADADQLMLRSDHRPQQFSTLISEEVSVVDLFSGCGGLTLGLEEAARALQMPFRTALAQDFDAAAVAVYQENYPQSHVVHDDVADVFDGAIGAEPTTSEQSLASRLGQVSVLLGGPPCQGHSDLNNQTRRSDPKNELYFRMVRAAEILNPENILIENVPGAINDKGRVVQRTVIELERMGYFVSYGILDGRRLGVAQSRRRLFVVASKARPIDVAGLNETYAQSQRSVGWAIGDLVGRASASIYDEPANSAPTTRDRIDFLFNRDLFNLPDSERPPCHRDKDHSYTSIYGRLKWTEPSQTITRGFYSMCMGRYVHPRERRTITAHEAARLQFLPDYFTFNAVTKRSDLAILIGNAVPMRFGYVLGLELLR